MKIIDIKLVTSSSIDHFNVALKKYIDDGWELNDNHQVTLTTGGSIIFSQMMIKCDRSSVRKIGPY